MDSTQTRPGPPQGPGVAPPFVTPPTDGTRQRRWLAVGLATGAAVVVCVGGLFSLGGLFVLGTQMVIEQSRAAVTDFLTAITDGEYEAAYDQQCSREKTRLSQEQFILANSGQAKVVSFSVGDPDLSSEPIKVPATLQYSQARSVAVRFLVETDTSTGDYQVCGREG